MSVTGTPIVVGSASGSYIDQSDIETHFGANNIIKWSNLDNDSTSADTTRIQKAIDYAEEHIDNRFRNGKYTIPFVATIPDKVKEWAAKLAGCSLYFSRGLSDDNLEGNKLKIIQDKIEVEIDQCLAGIIELDVSLTDSSAPTAPRMI